MLFGVLAVIKLKKPSVPAIVKPSRTHVPYPPGKKMTLRVNDIVNNSHREPENNHFNKEIYLALRKNGGGNTQSQSINNQLVDVRLNQTARRINQTQKDQRQKIFFLTPRKLRKGKLN
jgi:hypothetical protein